MATSYLIFMADLVEFGRVSGRAGGITFTASNWPSTGSACVRALERAAARPLRPSHRQDYIAGGQSEPFDDGSAERTGDDFPPSFPDAAAVLPFSKTSQR